MNKRKSLLSGLFSLVSYTNRIIFLTVLFYIIFLIFSAFNENIGRFIFLYPEDIVKGKSIWTLFTSIFMHGSITHLFVNMLTLFFLGNFAEQIIGRKKFLLLYIISGVFGGIFYVLGAFIGTNIPFFSNALGTLNVPAVGASGALFGILGLLAILIPRFKVYLITGPIIVVIVSIILSNIFPSGFMGSVINILASIITLMMIYFMLSSNPNKRKYSLPIGMSMWVAPIVAIVPLVIISFIIPLPIGNTAHLGGLIVGLIYGVFLRFKYPKKIFILQKLLIGTK